MDNPLSWDYMTTVPTPDEVFDPFTIAYVVLFGFGFVLSIILYNGSMRRFANHSLKRRTMRRGSSIAMTVFGIGLFFFGMRALQINPFTFGLAIWMWLSVLAAIGMFAYFAFYLRTAYRPALRAYEEKRMKRAALLRPATAGAGGAPREVVEQLKRYEAKRPVKRRKRR